MTKDMKRIILDWGLSHRLLDAMQVACGEKDLTPRVRFFITAFLRHVGWPEGEKPPEWWMPIEDSDIRHRVRKGPPSKAKKQ